MTPPIYVGPMSVHSWARLPNAKHIDRIRRSRIQYPAAWTVGAPVRCVEELYLDILVAYEAAMDAATAAGRVRDMYTAQAVPLGPALYATSALIAWDDCAHLLDQPVDAVRLLATCGHHPAVLLLPACIAFED
jgi:hypothetical protein